MMKSLAWFGALGIWLSLGLGWAGDLPDSVLFIGNSFTMGAGNGQIVGEGGVPGIVARMAKERGLHPTIKMAAEVKLTLGDHLEGTSRAVTLAQSRAWDVIVLQDLSTAPTNFGERLVDEYAAGLKQFKELIKASSSDTKIVLFETWARQARHKLYKGDNAPFPGGPQEMQQIVTGNIKKSAQEIGATVAPIGQAFLLCGEEKPEIVIYLEDDYHANANGCYLAALVLFAHIFQADPRGLPALYEIPDEVAEDLQKIAWQVVSASNPATPASATSAQP